MNYQEFLQRFQYQDSPNAQQEFQAKFGGSENLGLGPQIELQERGVHGRLMSNPREVLYSTEGQEGSNFLVATDRYHNEFPLSGALENYEEPRWEDAEMLNQSNTGVLQGGGAPPFQGGGLTGEGELVNPWEMQVGGTDNFPIRPSGIEAAPFPYASSSFFEGSPSSGTEGQYINSSGLLASTSEAPVYDDATLKALGIGSGADAGSSATEIADSVTAAEEGLLAIEAAEAAESGWGGPATFAANQALNLIPTRDREKKSTPFGDEGSMSGILKGTGKGALFGATIGSAFPVVGTTVGAVGGGVLGALGGAQGYFDSTSAPMMYMSRIRRGGGGGMQGGLLGGGSMYG